ncbi:polysaccharide deacetylase family protein [Armatimonas sp.]|uniref:polysaccharide deacetylase family protein n=1 Tax=Armatimonas sp. TaxID=1872638 RepID=UPI00286B21F8|nr:polysaccharide deacetylase family protein [Armatimonas sp.]
MSIRPIPILMYHAVETTERSDKYKHFYVTAKELQRQIKELKARGYQAISLDQLVAGLAGGPLPAKPVVLTFDDGYQNVLTNVHPTLSEANWPYAIYLVSERLGGRNEWVEAEGYDATPLLTEDEIRELAQSPLVTLGAHTATHPKLDQLSLDTARSEIFRSKQQLEETFQRPMQHFCYPYGHFNNSVVALVREAGYLTATTTQHGRVQESGEDLLRLPRVSIYHVPAFSLTYGPGALNFRWRVESRKDKRELG